MSSSRELVKTNFNAFLFEIHRKRASKFTAVRECMNEFVDKMYEISMPPACFVGRPISVRCKYRETHLTWWRNLLRHQGIDWSNITIHKWFQESMFVVRNIKAIRTGLRPILVEFFPKELCNIVEQYNMDTSYHPTHVRNTRRKRPRKRKEDHKEDHTF